jgi:prephenate dehydrogenase
MDHSSEGLKQSHLHIVGLGLMGASLARALRGKVSLLSGSDIRPELEAQACHDQVIDHTGGVEQADIVVVAVPSHHIIPTLGHLAYKPGALVLDMGSSKHQICQFMDTLPPQVNAVGGHPMCGLAENGYQNAIPTLYYKARFILCETARTTQGRLAICRIS